MGSVPAWANVSGEKWELLKVWNRPLTREFLLNSLPLCPTGLTNIMFQKLPQGKQENLPATRDLILHTGLGPGWRWTVLQGHKLTRKARRPACWLGTAGVRPGQDRSWQQQPHILPPPTTSHRHLCPGRRPSAGGAEERPIRWWNKRQLRCFLRE